jgi:putative ABC transport system permease protein
VDYNFFDVMGIELLAGRNFSSEITTDAGVLDEDGRLLELALVVNEETVTKFGWGTPEEALGKRIIRDPGAVDFTGIIIGVVRNFHFESLRQPLGPLAISVFPGRSYVAIKVGREDLPRTLAYIEEVTKQFVPGESFEISFLDEDFAELYESDQKTADVLGYVSALAILIACLGLFGLSTYAAERRTKEIGIRKVMGASVANIVGLLSADFLKLVVLAFVVAVPVAYFIMQQWLDGFAYQTDLSAGVFLMAGLSALLIGVLSVNYQSVRAALADPVKSLRYE